MVLGDIRHLHGGDVYCGAAFCLSGDEKTDTLIPKYSEIAVSVFLLSCFWDLCFWDAIFILTFSIYCVMIYTERNI